MTITTKQQMYDLLHAGTLGNRWWGWRDPEEFLEHESKFFPCPTTKGWAVRSMVPGGPFVYGVSFWWAYHFARANGGEISPIDEVLGFSSQHRGEFVRTVDGLALTLLGTEGNWRNAPRRHLYGSAATRALSEILREDYDWVMDVHERFPDAVVEFGNYDRLVGVDSKRTVIWEVRNY